MKTIEEKYAEHEIPEDIKDYITDPYLLVLKIDSLNKKLEREERQVARRKRRNQLAQKVFISERDILKQEESCLDEMLEILNDCLELLTSTVEALTESNYEELIKVVDFLVVQYLENKGYVAGRIETLNHAVDGFTYVDYRHENTHAAVKEFLTKKLDSMKKQKQLEKREEM